MKKILFVFTGGTIGSTVNGKYICTDENKPYVLTEGYKERFGEFGTYDTIAPYTVLSENLNGEHISKLICVLRENVKKDYAGIIVTHGTDTLAYFASALSYALGKIFLPVCIVSANYPLEDRRSNGYKNLHGAISFIKNVGEGGVWVSYKNKGDRVRIHRGSRLCPHVCFSDSVFSVKDSYYGYFDKNGEFVKNPKYREMPDGFSFKEDCVLQKTCKTVVRITPYPGMIYPEIDMNVRCIILGSYHSGTVDTLSREARAFYDEMKRRNIPVFMTGVGTDVPYESTKVYEELGIIPLPCISPVAAYMKLWLLENNKGFSRDGEKIKKYLLSPCGGDVV